MVKVTGDQSANVSGTKIIDSRCVVEFRPGDDWHGEYGFDWFRGGNHEVPFPVDMAFKFFQVQQGDTEENINGKNVASEYTEIVGHYTPVDPDDDPNYPNSNSYNIKLKPIYNGRNYINELVEEYPIFTVKGFANRFYLAPYISLYYMSDTQWSEGQPRRLPAEMCEEGGSFAIKDICKTLVTIKANINAKNIDRIELECDNCLSVAPQLISPVQDGKSSVKIAVRLNYDFCEDHKSIKVKAYHKDRVTSTFAGQINIVRCKPKVIDVCFVNVKLDRGQNNISSGFPSLDFIEEQKKNLSRFLSQAHVIPNITEADLDLDINDLYSHDFIQLLTNDGGYTKYESIILNGVNGSHGDNDAFGEFLENTLNQSGVYKVFFIDEIGVAFLNGMYLEFNGLAHGIPSETLVIYKNPSVSLVSHEILHCFGLWHSFSNNSVHTFEKYKTSNIMDYSKDTYTLWKWQWEKININANGRFLIDQNS